MVVANVVGGATVFFFLGFVLPWSERYLPANVAALIAYMTAAMVVGCVVSARAFLPIREWALGNRAVTTADRTYIVRQPLRQTVINFTLWVGSLLVFVPI